MRFGVAGIFLSRFLPGVRAVVPPFAGPGGSRLGPDPRPDGPRQRHLVRRDHLRRRGARRGVGAASLTIIAGREPHARHRRGRWARSWRRSGIWLARRRRKQERVWHATRDALDPAAPSFLAGTELAEGSARQAAALLVLELAYADPVLTPRRSRRWSPRTCGSAGASAATAHPPAPPPEDERRSRFAGYARDGCGERFGRAQRLELVERMWLVAFSDGGAIGAHEDRLMSPGGRAAGRRAGRGDRGVAARSGAAEPRDDRRDSATRCDRDFWLEGFRDYLALESGHSGNTVEAYLRDLRAAGASSRRRKGCAIPARSPARSSATSSTCSRTWASAPPRSGARCRPSGPTTAFWSARAACATDPSDRLETPRRGRVLPDTLTVAEVEALLAAPDIDEPLAWRDRALLELGYGAGLRVSELCGLGITDLLLTEDLVRVFGKGGKERLVPIGRTSIGAVSVYLHQLRPSSIAGRAGAGCCSTRGASRSRGSAPGAS